MKYKFTSRDWINFVAMVGICVLTFGLYSITFSAEAVNVTNAPETTEATDIEDDIQSTVASETKKHINLAVPVFMDIPEDPGPKPIEMHVEPPKYTTTSKPQEYPSEPPEAPESDESNTDVELTDVEMLAIVIYQEVGGNAHCDLCRYRVGDIVLNRVAHPDFPNTIYDVLTQPYQYGRLAWTGIKWADRANNPYEADAVARARRIANDILNGNHSELYGKGYIWQAAHVQGSDGFWCCGHYFARG